MEKRQIDMKKKQFTEAQILNVLQAKSSGHSVPALCREYGVSAATIYRWEKKYGDMGSEELNRLRSLEQENANLKKMYAELSLDHELLKRLLGKKS